MQQHGSTYFARRPPTTLPHRPWGQGQNAIFSEHGHVAYQIKGNQECSTMVANILTTDPPRPLGSKGQNSIFSEHGHVAYRIKGNHECSNMVVNILPTDPPPLRPLGSIFYPETPLTHILPADPLPPPRLLTLGVGVKIQLFQNMVMLHIKLKGMEHRAP